jgi:hypothetical protein
MPRTEIPWSQVLSIWWAAAWRAALFGYGITPVIGFVFALTVRSDLQPWLAPILSIWPPAVTVWALWFALSTEYRGFRIVIAPR